MIARAMFAGALLALVPITVVADSPPTGNSVFQIVMEEASGGDGKGVFGIITGPEHPLGAGAELLSLRDNNDAFASYLTIRSYTTGTDYVQTSSLPASANPVVPLDPYASVAAISGGYRAAYDIPPSSPSAESLIVTFDLTVNGDEADSAVGLSVSITNENIYPIEVGARFLLDISTSGDDGPVVAASSLASDESRLTPLPDSVAIPPPGTPGISLIAASPGPDAITLAHWNRAFESAFDFQPDGTDVTSTSGLNDSALLYYFGATEDTAVPIASGATSSMALTIAQPASEVCDNGVDDDLDTLVDTTDPDCTVSPAPTAPSVAPQPSAAGISPTGSPSPSPGPGALPTTGGFLGVGARGLSLALATGVALVAIGMVITWQVRRSD